MFKRLKWKRKAKPVLPTEPIFQQMELVEPQTPMQKENSAWERTVYLFPVSMKGVGGSKWGYMNGKGHVVLKPTFNHAGDFQDNGLAIVRINDRTGIIDTSGYFIVSPKYEAIHPFLEGRATIIDHQGYKVMDETGKILTSKAYSFIGGYREGRALFSLTNEKGRSLYGFLNRRGKEVLPAVYESASDFKEGKAVVKLKENLYALINLTGKVMNMYSFCYVGDYGEGLLSFQKNAGGKFGYIDEQGKIIIEPRFGGAQTFQGSCAIVTTADGQQGSSGLINKKGQYILKPNYDQISHLGEGRLAIAKAVDPEKPYNGSFYALGDTQGQILTGFIFNGMTKYKNGVASANNDQFTFFIDKKGKKIPTLPSVKGNGHLHFEKTLIRGEIDFRHCYFKRDGELVWKQNANISLREPYAVCEEKYKPNKDFLVYYPQLTGLVNRKAQEKINQYLKDLAGIKETPAHLQLESNYMGDFEVIFSKKELLVIEISGCHYQLGAAHGMPVKKYVHIDLKTGEIFHLKDLFKPVSPYVKMISEHIGNQIKNNHKFAYVFPGSYKGIHVDQPFFISEKGINLYFLPNEIAPFTAGFPTFIIPFEELTQIIDPKSSFWQSLY